MNRVFSAFFSIFALFLFSGMPSVSAHMLIPQDIMDEVLANPDITDEEIDQMFLDRYQMTVDEYQEKKAIEEEIEYQKSLEDDPEFAAYVKSLEEGNGYAEVLTNAYSTEEAQRKNSEISKNFFKKFLEKIQQAEVSALFSIRSILKEEEKNPENSEKFLEKMMQSVWAGMLHIFGGIDHILFLLTLILLARPFRKILVIISAFTLAHSLTLFLVGAKILSVNTQLIEVIIAVSIVYSAGFAGITLLKKPEISPLSSEKSRNFWDKNLLHTLAIVFIFGLFHGMGFAETFKDFQFEFSEYWSALLVFNGGVEIAQIILLIAFYPLIVFLHKRYWGKAILVLLSGIIAVSAVFWVVERIQ